jgi:proteasome component ECM29
LTELGASITSPAVRKSFCIWLLCITKFCGEHSGLKPFLKKIHSIFSLLLADRDAFTQDCASKGIGIVYELGDAGLKQELVDSLVSTLSEGRKVAAQSVRGDTELFGENSMGTQPDGSSITTYQSILSLASDMNQPEIVYKVCKVV